MKNRKNIKIEVNMFNNTKFKIIDTKENRDIIHYVWFRSMILAGKSDKEGELYLSSNIPFTVETMALEFNRSEKEIKEALSVLIELEMISVTEKGIFRVKNFAKYQNINTSKRTDNKIKEQADLGYEHLEDKDNKNTIESETKEVQVLNNDTLKTENEDKNKEGSLTSNNKSNLKDEELINVSPNCNSLNIKKERNIIKKKRTKSPKKNNNNITCFDVDEDVSDDCWNMKIDGDDCKCVASWSC